MDGMRQPSSATLAAISTARFSPVTTDEGYLILDNLSGKAMPVGLLDTLPLYLIGSAGAWIRGYRPLWSVVGAS